ncbi:hypothetical protein FQ022_23605, partial [Escherichia coli]|nr:hypothetical protein [Escherichia coli]
GPIRHADCRQRKLADFLCTGGIIQGRIRRSRRIRHKLQLADCRCEGIFAHGVGGMRGCWRK